jgi:hypothetical protein
MFFVLIALEWVALAWKRRWPTATPGRGQGYRLNDALGSVLLGTFQQVFVVLVEVLLGLSVETTCFQVSYDPCTKAISHGPTVCEAATVYSRAIQLTSISAEVASGCIFE